MPTAPQDRKTGTKSKLFAFHGPDGKRHTLPTADQAREKLSGRDVHDAIVGGEDGELLLMFKMVDLVASPAAATALYDRPQAETVQILKDWGEHGDGDGASLGESSGSST